MRPLLMVACLSVALAGCSSGPDVSTPTAACNSASTTLCNRYFACDSAGATAAWGSASNCASHGVGLFTCATAACTSPRTFNSSNAASCVDGLGSISCTAFSTGVSLSDVPQSCFNICQCPGNAMAC